MNRRDFVQALAATAVGTGAAPFRLHAPKKLDRIGLELWTIRRTMAKDPDRTLAAVRAIGYTDVEVLWSMDNFHRTAQQVRDALAREGLRAPSAHIDQDMIFIGWERRLETAKMLGHEYLVVPSFSGSTARTLDDWRAWADHFNRAGAQARRAGIWLAFHNEADHMELIEGKIPYDIFVERTDPSLVRLQLDTGNMVMGGGDPMQYLARYKDRYHLFHLKDAVADHKSDTELGKGTFDFKRFLAAVPDLAHKPCYVEQEEAKDEMASAREDYEYLHNLDF